MGRCTPVCGGNKVDLCCCGESKAAAVTTVAARGWRVSWRYNKCVAGDESWASGPILLLLSVQRFNRVERKANTAFVR